MIFPAHWLLSLPLKNRYPRGFSVYPAASQPAVFALEGYPVHLAESQSARFSLGRQRKCNETHMDDHRRKRRSRSFKWYQSLFGQPETPPGHDYFGQILDTDGTVLLCLHQWGAHDHPILDES